jgi:hypothetical protein
MKILIAGDSFAVNQDNGWSDLLSDSYAITNIAQAGVSEYKILKQLQSENLTKFDRIIIVHTSPYRVHIQNHPTHNTGLHANCDLLLADLENVSKSNSVVEAGLLYFKYIFDPDYYTDIYSMMLETINAITKPYSSLHLCFFDNDLDYPFDNFIDFNSVFKMYPGTVNHLSTVGTMMVHDRIDQWLRNS